MLTPSATPPAAPDAPAQPAPAAVPSNTRLAVAYQMLRRREYELITELLDLLPGVDGLDPAAIGQVRDALFHADHPFLIVFMGPFSSGKSSLINALLGDAHLLPVGPTPTTERVVMLRHGEEAARVRTGDVDTRFYPSPLLERVSFVDTPGLESVFSTHEAATRDFLHRSDAVFLVMLATQAMTASSREYLKMLRAYDKRVIILINQVDVLSEDEQQAVLRYTVEQSAEPLGAKPTVWLVSSKQGLEANGPDGLDEPLWRASGLAQITDYITEQFDDAARLRQKLQTPLQIAQNAHAAAMDRVRVNQALTDQYARIGENIAQQMGSFRREQEKSAAEVRAEIDAQFATAITRSTEAIRELFALPRAFGLGFSALAELLGLAGLVRGGKMSTYAETAFERRAVFAPIEALPAITNRLPPRLEGKDLQDIDSLTTYARREIDALPAPMREKVIGAVQPPLSYNRSMWAAARADLEKLEAEARAHELKRIEHAVRDTLLYLGFYEAMLIVLLVVLAVTTPFPAEDPLIGVGVFVLIFALMLLGLVVLPLRGRAVADAFARRLRDVGRRYGDAYASAVEAQIAYGMRLRAETVSPLTRLIETQTGIAREQRERLQKVGTTLVALERDVSAFRA